MNAKTCRGDCKKPCVGRDGGGDDASSEFAALNRDQVCSGRSRKDATSEHVVSILPYGKKRSEEADTVKKKRVSYLWNHYRVGNLYTERCRRFQIKLRKYNANMPNTSHQSLRCELYEMNSPRVRHNRGEPILLEQFIELSDAQEYAETLTPWGRIPGTKNGWKKDDVIVTCKSMRGLPDDQTDDLGKRWSVYLDGQFVESCSNGKKAQMIGEELYESDEKELLDD